MISFYSIPTFLAAMAFFFTGWFVMSKNWKATLNRAFGTVCFILFIWTMSVSVTYSTQNPVVAKFFAVFTCMDIAVVPPTYYWLVAEILKLRKEQKWVILTFMITLVQLPLFLFTDLIILAEPHHYFYGYYSSAGPWHPAHLVIWYGIMARPFYLMFKTFLKVRKDYSVEANRKKYLVLAFIVVCFCSIDFVPKYGIEYYPF
ncbi:hypothetical protein KAR91_15845, partial [Candidatus Pacearchaeota archaeon]|nr:hypothetical protein [Candidatus Pacearchaeota archaeon]